MISAPLSMAEAVAELDRALARLNDYRAQLDNAFDLLQDASRLTSKLGTELRHSAAELLKVRDERDNALRLVNKWRKAAESLAAERDTWRTRATGSRQ